ncbi:MAG: sporulation membrane protein YtaF [Clostridia bacterium]|nr:MAG: sporulation membrane protein YtaF [Clostridia bacterium]
MELGSAVLFALAISVDTFGVGLAYGLRGIRVPAASRAIICLITVGIIASSLAAGTAVGSLIPAELGAGAGAAILVVLGAWLLAGAWSRHQPAPAREAYPLVKLRLPSVGLAIAILREPETADSDCSGIISPAEAVGLGVAMALDAMGAGFALALLHGGQWLVPPLAGALSLAALATGLKLGHLGAIRSHGLPGELLPGILLIILGLSQLRGI